MRAQEWRGCVDLLDQDGISLGQAMAQLYTRPSPASGNAWYGTLRADIGLQTRPWPTAEPVLVCGIGGQDILMRLVPALVEQGPVLIQVANVWTIRPTTEGYPSRSATAALKEGGGARL